MKAGRGLRDSGSVLTTVPETDGIFCPFESHRSWSNDRNHLFTPAIIKESHIAFFSMDRVLTQGKNSSIESNTGTIFGAYLLGEGSAKQVHDKENTQDSWSKSKFILRHNYLLEFKVEDEGDNSFPRSWLFLSPSFCSFQRSKDHDIGIEFVYDCSGKRRKSVRSRYLWRISQNSLTNNFACPFLF